MKKEREAKLDPSGDPNMELTIDGGLGPKIYQQRTTPPAQHVAESPIVRGRGETPKEGE